jgi:hypothetical protein
VPDVPLANQCIAPTCKTPRLPDSLVCAKHQDTAPVATGGDVGPLNTSALTDMFDEFSKNPMGYGALPITPKEGHVRAAKEMRSMFIAFVDQGFTEDQAMAIVGYSIGAMFAVQAATQEEQK